MRCLAMRNIAATRCRPELDWTDSQPSIALMVPSSGGAARIAELGAEVTGIGIEPDGFNINRESGSTYPQTICSLVKDCGADVGIAFDGDAGSGGTRRRPRPSC